MQETVKDQYRESSNLDARIALHRQYSTNPQGWFSWYLSQLDLPNHCRVLELGCGSAGLWKEMLQSAGAGWRLVLTDYSVGMAREASRLNDPLARFSFAAADAQQLPFPSCSFDAVLANHMLYHVPDLDRTLAEVRRVLRPGGRFFAATNGERHMSEIFDLEEALLREMGREEGKPALRKWGASFTLENGSAPMLRHFAQVKLVRYPDSLRVTQAEPLMAYILSMLGVFQNPVSAAAVDGFARKLAAQIQAEGAIHITKDSGIFKAVKSG